MFLSTLLYITSFLAVLFFITGTISLIRLYPVLNTMPTKGRIRDARITTDNVLGDDFSSPNTYIYFTYIHNGVAHGSSSASTENNAVSRSIVRSASDKFDKEGAFDVDVFVNKSDPRKAYLQSPETIKMKKLSLAIILTVISVLIYIYLRVSQ